MNALILTIAPVVLISVFIYIKDKYESEPKRLLFFSFLLGAVVSVLISTLIYLLIDFSLPQPDKFSVFQQFINAFFIVALTEEFSKYVIIRFYAQPKRAFNEPFDGIVYAVMVSLGFALTENIIYVFSYGGGSDVAIIRAFTAVPAHAICGVIMGYFMGKAKFNGKRIADNLIGLTLAILFHGTYDFFLFINFIPGLWFGAIIALILGYILARKAIQIHQKNSYFNKD